MGGASRFAHAHTPWLRAPPRNVNKPCRSGGKVRRSPTSVQTQPPTHPPLHWSRGCGVYKFSTRPLAQSGVTRVGRRVRAGWDLEATLQARPKHLNRRWEGLVVGHVTRLGLYRRGSRLGSIVPKFISKLESDWSARARSQTYFGLEAELRLGVGLGTY